MELREISTKFTEQATLIDEQTYFAKKMPFNSKVKYLVDSRFDGNQRNFGKFVGLSHQTVSNLIQKPDDSGPSWVILVKIVKAFPDLNLDWLIRDLIVPAFNVDQEKGDRVEEPPIEPLKKDPEIMFEVVMLKKDLYSSETHIDFLKRLLTEKDARIKLLEEKTEK